MKSAGLLDLAGPAAAPLQAGRSALPERNERAQAFGSLLKKATAQTEIAAEPVEESAIIAPEEEKKEDQNSVIVPFICICPPPVTQTLTLSPTNAVGSSPTMPIDAKIEAEPVPASQTETLSKSLAETVKPFQEPEPQAIPPDLVEPVTDEDLKLVKAVELARPPEPEELHGTPAAKMDNRVRNNEKSAEIAPAMEQKMPLPPAFRRISSEARATDPIQVGGQSDRILNLDFKTDAAIEVIPVKSLDAIHLVETIRTEVASLRQRGDVAMSVVLKPDSQTQLTVNISIGRDGVVHAQARCERGDFQALNTHWPQLQQSLATHGIRMNELANQNPSQHQRSSNFQNFDRGENHQQRNQSEKATFEQQLAAAPVRSPLKLQSRTPAAPARHWQSWA